VKDSLRKKILLKAELARKAVKPDLTELEQADYDSAKAERARLLRLVEKARGNCPGHPNCTCNTPHMAKLVAQCNELACVLNRYDQRHTARQNEAFKKEFEGLMRKAYLQDKQRYRRNKPERDNNE
jgi:hypothetical protein